MIKFFWCISLLLLSLACHRKLSFSSDYKAMTSKDQQAIIQLISVDQDSLKAYNTTIETYGKYFSGVTYFKNIHDSTLRVLFTTHTGMKLFDLELSDATCTTKYVIDQMNNPAVVKLLCHDFSLLTGGLTKAITPHHTVENESRERIAQLKVDKDLYYYLSSQGVVTKIVETAEGKRTIQTVLSKEEKDSSLTVKHYNFNVKLHFQDLK
jgi:hypothetical protein